MRNGSPLVCGPATRAVPTRGVSPLRSRSIHICLAAARVINRRVVNGCRCSGLCAGHAWREVGVRVIFNMYHVNREIAEGLTQIAFIGSLWH